MKNYYEILEVDKKATTAIIKAVYKIYIKKKHPDLFQGDEKLKAEEELKKLNEAYETLSDEQKRAEYDKTLNEEQSLNKEFIDEIMQENIRLKEMLGEKENTNELNEIENKQHTSFEYEPTAYETDQNNTKYLMKLIWKERLLRLIIVVTCVVAFAAGLYKSAGINIFESFWNAFVNAFGGNN